MWGVYTETFTHHYASLYVDTALQNSVLSSLNTKGPRALLKTFGVLSFVSRALGIIFVLDVMLLWSMRFIGC